MLRGQAEALARLDRGREAVTAAAEATRIFASLGRSADEALARYWMAYGLYLSDAEADARSMLMGLLERVRGGLKVEPEFEMRLLIALASVESRTGNYAESLAHLEAARGMADDLDDRRRAMFLFNLAISYRETGDMEAAIRDRHAGPGAPARGRLRVRIGADRERPRHGLPGHRGRRASARAWSRRRARSSRPPVTRATWPPCSTPQAQVALASGEASRGTRSSPDARWSWRGSPATAPWSWPPC